MTAIKGIELFERFRKSMAGDVEELLIAKGFTLKSVLTAHEATHNNDRPFKCPHCPNAFGAKSKSNRI